MAELGVAKQAISYYVSVSGESWDTFFNNLDGIVAGDLTQQTGNEWLVHALVNTIIKNGLPLSELKDNKDALKALFDEAGRKLAGEFFTPEVWAEEGRKLLDQYIPNWRETYNLYEPSVGAGNLIRNANMNNEHLFASTLQPEDIEALKTDAKLQGATLWAMDFLSAVDTPFDMAFSEKLPERLRQILENDEPLIIYANPPYKTGQAKATEVGRFMGTTGTLPDYDFTDMSKPAYDIFYQFCFQFMHLVNTYNLHNTYYWFFGPLTFFTGSGANILLRKFEHCFEFIDGMCISAQEFSDTSESILWGIGVSLWKARGGYQSGPDEQFHKDILLSKKYLIPEGGVGTEGKILYEPPREKLSTWVEPKDVVFYDEAPLMTSHLTFKGGDVFEKTAYKTAKIAQNALGTLMLGNTLTRSSDQSAILSVPSTIQYTSITEENFWRCVSSYTFRRVFEAGWAIAKKEISAPNTNVEGYDIWLKNALVMFLFEYKSMMNSLRNVKSVDGLTTYTIRNKLFYLSEEQVRSACHDEVILKDLEENPPLNQFMLKTIEECKPYWSHEIRHVYDWCVDVTLKSYDLRKSVNYKGSLECWDAGFQQIRSGCWGDDNMSTDLSKILVAARDYLSKDLLKFGFVTDVENNSGI